MLSIRAKRVSASVTVTLAEARAPPLHLLQNQQVPRDLEQSRSRAEQRARDTTGSLHTHLQSRSNRERVASLHSDRCHLKRQQVSYLVSTCCGQCKWKSGSRLSATLGNDAAKSAGHAVRN